MKKINFKGTGLRVVSLLTVGAMLYSCEVDHDRNINNNFGQTQEQMLQGLSTFTSPLNTAIKSIIDVSLPDWSYQIQQNLNADIFSGYMEEPVTFGNDTNNSQYFMMDGWNGQAWDRAYHAGVMDNTQSVLQNVEQLKKDQNIDLSQYAGLAKIIRVEGMHRVSDIYGPIIYTHFGENSSGDKFDNQKDTYYAFFSDLDDGIALLKAAQARGESGTILPTADPTNFAGDPAKWIHFANSLRLRLAMRISNIDPTKAQTEAQKALTDDGGLLQPGEDLAVQHLSPLNTLSLSWINISMGAPMESILKGYSDPRLEVYFSPSGLDGNYHGIRQGIEIGTNQDQYQKLSLLGSGPIATVQLMTSAEVQFLIAEARLKGWASGSVQEAYENGIKTSFAQRGTAIGNYLQTTSLPMDYVDPINSKYNIAATSTISVKWNDGDSNAIKMEKIITQKWIANFPEGQEAWSEFRRTGYPKLFPVAVNKSGGAISTSKFVKRLPFASSEKATNGANVQAAVGLLGGPDTGGTNLWWDTNK